MIKFLPNIITIFRIILVPFFIYFLINDFVHSKLYATIIFGIASISDIIDGKIARKYGIVTRFGTFMDPLADKILVVSALLVFVFFKYIPLWMVIIIISRLRHQVTSISQNDSSDTSVPVRTLVGLVGKFVLSTLKLSHTSYDYF